MAKKSKDNKNLIIGICAVVAVVAVIVVAVVLATRGGINDDYFVSDDTKYVLTVEMEDAGMDGESYTPLKTHVVYTYKDNDITGMKTYAVYKDADAAKKAYDAMKDAGEDMTDVVVEGKYIVKTNAAEEYESMKASDVKSYIDLMESLKNLGTGDTVEEDVEEDVEEVKEEE